MGRMKSLAYAYAQYISAETGADEMDVFGDIVDGGVDIPKWFINEWLVANPIFASEEIDDKTIEMLIARGYILSPNGDPTNPDHWSNPPEISKPTAGPTSWTPAAETFGAEDYEVIMTNIGHSMERDGETIVFGDVVFATPNDGRSRISSYGQGADKASARQALIDRATDYLQEEEFNVEENFTSLYGRSRMPAGRARCEYTGLPIASWMIGSANGVCPLVEPLATTEQIEDWITWMATNYSDWYPRLRGAIIELNNGNILLTPEDLEVYNAETKSWRFQKRDSSGKFTKGFVEEVEISELPENLPLKEVSLPVIFEEQDVLDFINGAIADDNFPEKLSDPKFIQLCSDVAAAAPMALLKHLNVVANIRQLENLMSGSEEETVAAGRAIFVTDFMLNFKEGQDYWAAEEE